MYRFEKSHRKISTGVDMQREAVLFRGSKTKEGRCMTTAKEKIRFGNREQWSGKNERTGLD